MRADRLLFARDQKAVAGYFLRFLRHAANPIAATPAPMRPMVAGSGTGEVGPPSQLPSQSVAWAKFTELSRIVNAVVRRSFLIDTS